MKIKLDFVTNSSSTAYVVMIPKNFDVVESFSKIQNGYHYEEDLGEEFNDNEAAFLEAIISNIEKLTNGEES